ncbi:phosphoribosylanthranilate isomerase [Lichenihabitans psoromatis]|uniref:phosphoribosylanthranilate isomerase n=1 Tax=Lichenihabitans psoromatis TaxID=2528642 RepID=UPI0014796C1B|nr:phosphoribosylanthranilate isomerase [Lichenihabitans psoromatis]
MLSPLIKICGLSTAPTMEVALEVGVDLVGLVFFARSPRHVTHDVARQLAQQARGRAEIVALTVDVEDAALDALMKQVAPDLLQLHGRETPERVAAIKARTGRSVIKAIGLSTRSDLAQIQAYGDVADMILFDAKPPPQANLPGGNGVPFDWSLLSGLDLKVPFMLSGGLSLGNVETALRLTRAPGVDVSSGVESSPGRKDPDKIRAFVLAVRRAATSMAESPVTRADATLPREPR